MIMTSFSRALSIALFCSCTSFATIAAASAGAEPWTNWRKAITANNLDAVMAVYAEDAVMWLPDAPEAKGREAIRKSYEALLAANTVTGATLANTHYQTSGDLSVGWGDFTPTCLQRAGAIITLLGALLGDC